MKHFRGCSNHRDEPRMVLRAHWTANRPGDHRTCTARKCKCTPSETKSANKSMDVTLIPFLDFVVKSDDITWPIHPIKVENLLPRCTFGHLSCLDKFKPKSKSLCYSGALSLAHMIFCYCLELASSTQYKLYMKYLCT